MLVTKEDLYEGLIFNYNNTKSIYKITKITENSISIYSYQTNQIYDNHSEIEEAIRNFNNKEWNIDKSIELTIENIYECW